MPEYSTFTLWKRTGTYSDTLAAAGLSKLLWTLQGGAGNRVEEESACFRVK